MTDPRAPKVRVEVRGGPHESLKDSSQTGIASALRSRSKFFFHSGTKLYKFHRRWKLVASKSKPMPMTTLMRRRSFLRRSPASSRALADILNINRCCGSMSGISLGGIRNSPTLTDRSLINPPFKGLTSRCLFIIFSHPFHRSSGLFPIIELPLKMVS